MSSDPLWDGLADDLTDKQSRTEHVVYSPITRLMDTPAGRRNDLNENAIDDPARNWEE